MFRLFPCILFLILCSTLNARPSYTDSLRLMLQQLDQVVENRSIYDNRKEQKIERLKESIPLAGNDSVRYEIYNKLFREYFNYQTDSALHYVSLKENLAKAKHWDYEDELRMNRSELFSTMGMYKEAIDMLEKIDSKKLSTSQLRYYYSMWNSLYGLIAGYSLTQKERDIYYQTSTMYRDSLIPLYSPDVEIYYRLQAGQFIARKAYQEAVDVLKSVPTELLEGHSIGLVAFDLSTAYEGLGDTEQEMYYLAKSAIVDLKLSIKEYIALHKLAYLLYQQGDIERAYKYLNRSMADAVFCNARFRAISITQSYPIIDQAYRIKSAQELQLRQILMSISLGVSLLLIGMVLYIYRQMRKLKVARLDLSKMNEQLQHVNKQLYKVNQELSSVNLIKQEYIVHYLDQCTMYLDKMEKYRRSLENLSISKDLKALFKAIKSESFITEEREKFYKSFDETFLSLFPHFVESLNALLRDDEQLHPHPGELLSTELRIFALIRLGITDSNKIARFLRYSLTTIYNYRSKVRNKAKDKIQFETQVGQIQS
jgi:DNA-binding CsgD family transcriptional regulator/tetratricopeptide (TPR) repeat protein